MAKENDDGYIKISRKLLDWDHADNLSMTGFWVILLLKAQWEDSKKLKRGEFYTTQEALAIECGIHRATVSKYLEALRKSGQIKTSTDHRRTKIKIIKWDEYQMSKKTTTATTTAATTTTTTATTTHLYKRNKEEKKKRREEAQPPTLSEIKKYIEENGIRIDPARFFEYYQDREWRNVPDWRKKVREWQKTEKQKRHDILPAYMTGEQETTTEAGEADLQELEEIMDQLKR